MSGFYSFFASFFHLSIVKQVKDLNLQVPIITHFSFNQGYLLTRASIKNLCINSDSVTLSLPLTKFEAVPSKDVG